MTRKELIISTARKLIVQNGLYDASIAKIAKEANIPVGSVYTYFKSKEDLINEIFSETKQEMGSYIFQSIEKTLSEKEELQRYWERAIDFGLKNQEKFFFVEQFSNSPLLAKQNKEMLEKIFERLFLIFFKGINDGVLKNIDVLILHQIVYFNIIGIIKFYAESPRKLTPKVKAQLFECCWDSIKI